MICIGWNANVFPFKLVVTMGSSQGVSRDFLRRIQSQEDLWYVGVRDREWRWKEDKTAWPGCLSSGSDNDLHILPRMEHSARSPHGQSSRNLAFCVSDLKVLFVWRISISCRYIYMESMRIDYVVSNASLNKSDENLQHWSLESAREPIDNIEKETCEMNRHFLSWLRSSSLFTVVETFFGGCFRNTLGKYEIRFKRRKNYQILASCWSSYTPDASSWETWEMTE